MSRVEVRSRGEREYEIEHMAAAEVGKGLWLDDCMSMAFNLDFVI